MSKLIECTLCKYRTYKQFNMNRHCGTARHKTLLFKTIEEQKNEQIKEQEIIINDEKSYIETENTESSIKNIESDSHEQKQEHIIIKEPLFYMLDEITDEESSMSEEINIECENKFELPNINYVKNNNNKIVTNNPNNKTLFKLGATMITGGLILPMM